MCENLDLFRKRYIPNEIVHLKDDVILLCQKDLILTSWNTLKPRPDFVRGVSAYFLKDGFKISKIYDREDHLVYWYCDIIDTEYRAEQNSIIFHDLILDLIIRPDGTLKVMDLDELADCLETGIVSQEFAIKAMRRLGRLLDYAYTGEIERLKKVLEDNEP
ncbi:DUF402 domain-containing protein [Anaerolentibacter hominis]|uniref:DUF402 domain-containing protein n=1 Tax=Anaerolentibacter hominis TaxID=3079009 RepID=UPI0031B8565F